MREVDRIFQKWNVNAESGLYFLGGADLLYLASYLCPHLVVDSSRTVKPFDNNVHFFLVKRKK
jgi:hypothetical protein